MLYHASLTGKERCYPVVFWELRFWKVCIGSANFCWVYVSCLPLATGTFGCSPQQHWSSKVQVSRL
ncbi:hypothetical protein U0070_009318 [Myodes glareolus]|uniref:Uncharacterized protein n=1 Tax=Myodes glareolus TaxID=447135 RepID=A0AAW0GWV8_MYOGA